MKLLIQVAHCSLFCAQGSDETQEHLQLCGGTKFERRGLDLSDKRGTTGLLKENEDEACCSDLRDHQPGV